MNPSLRVVSAVMILALAGSARPAERVPAASSPDAPKRLAVPEGNGKPVLLDGLFAPGEWDDALKVPIHERIDLFLKTNSGHLFLGLKFEDAAGVIVDLWMTSDDKTVYQLHSSGQLGEGTLSLPAADEWPGTLIGYSKDWDANEIKSDSKKKAQWQAAGRPEGEYRKVLFPSDGKEFQIVLSKFPGRRLKMRFRSGDPEGLVIYPKNTDLKSADGWLELVVDVKKPAADDLSRPESDAVPSQGVDGPLPGKPATR